MNFRPNAVLPSLIVWVLYDSFIPSPRSAIDGLPETNDTFVISNEPHGQTPRHIERCTSLENYRGSPFVVRLQVYSSPLAQGFLAGEWMTYSMYQERVVLYRHLLSFLHHRPLCYAGESMGRLCPTFIGRNPSKKLRIQIR